MVSFLQMSYQRRRARDARRPQAMILTLALCATAAAFVGPINAPKTTALQHHKVRSQVADLKIYREEIDRERAGGCCSFFGKYRFDIFSQNVADTPSQSARKQLEQEKEELHNPAPPNLPIRLAVLPR